MSTADDQLEAGHAHRRAARGMRLAPCPAAAHAGIRLGLQTSCRARFSLSRLRREERRGRGEPPARRLRVALTATEAQGEAGGRPATGDAAHLAGAPDVKRRPLPRGRDDRAVAAGQRQGRPARACTARARCPRAARRRARACCGQIAGRLPGAGRARGPSVRTPPTTACPRSTVRTRHGRNATVSGRMTPLARFDRTRTTPLPNIGPANSDLNPEHVASANTRVTRSTGRRLTPRVREEQTIATMASAKMTGE